MPFVHPGEGLEGETCKGALALQLCGYRCSLHSLSSSPLEGGLGGAGFSVDWAPAWSQVLPNQKSSWSVQSEGRGLSCTSSLSWLVSVLGGASWVVSISSPLQSDVGWQEHLTFSVRHVLQQSSNIGMCGGEFLVRVAIYENLGGIPQPLTMINKCT